MSYNPSEHMSQTPSRNQSQQELTIRSTTTSGQNSAQTTQTSHPTQQRQTQGRNGAQPSQPSPTSQPRPYPSYPIAIPPEKFERALILLNILRLREGLAQREPTSSLGVPPHTAHPPSVSSHASSGSHTPSTRNGGTVVSFDDNESPSSAAANAGSEPISYDGKRIKQRKRDPLKPVPRARAALIRHLGSCWVCRSRRVSCPLEHHDIAVLDAEVARRARLPQQPPRQPARERSVTAPERQRPMIVNTDNSGRRRSDRVLNTFSNELDHVLTGIGHGSTNLSPPGFESTPIDNTLPIHGDDIFVDPLIGIEARSQYTSYQDGQMFQLGVLRDFYFACQHLGGNCRQLCSTVNDLETHFEEAHFAYTRITPSHRYHCLMCGRLQGSVNGLCECGYSGQMEVKIYGNFIRMPTYQRYAPDGQDFFTEHGNQFSAPLYISDSNPDIGRGMGNHGGFDMNFDGMNQGGFYQNHNSQHAPGPGPQNNFGFDTQQPGGFQFQGSQFGDTSDIDEPISVDITNPKFPGTCRWQKPIFIVAAVLFATSFVTQTEGWVIAKGKVVEFQPFLPFLGFMALFASFVISQKFLAIKHPGCQFGENLQRSILQSPFDKLSSSSAIPFKYRPAARAIRIRGGIYL